MPRASALSNYYYSLPSRQTCIVCGCGCVCCVYSITNTRVLIPQYKCCSLFQFLVSKDTNKLDLMLQATYNHVGDCSPPPDQSDCSIHYNNYDLMNIFILQT